MKECRDCEYFNDYYYSDGTPDCEYDGGYESCPYCNDAPVKKNGFKIEIDAGFMHEYITHTLKNTIEYEARNIAQSEIQSIVTKELKESILEEMKSRVREIVEQEIAAFMGKEITIGGGWREPERKLTREEYLSELVENELEKRTKEDAIGEYARREAKNAIDKFGKTLRDGINAGVKTYFNQATRQVLTENVVSMLMCNDTYQKLATSMQTFLPEKNS